MLKITDLENFCNKFQAATPKITKALILVDDDDYTKFVKEVSHKAEEALLIAVIPSVSPKIKDKDNFKFVNYLHFFIVQKHDSKGSYESYLNKFKFTQPLIKALFNYIFLTMDNFNECIFKDFNLSSLSIDPVTDKIRTYGYSLSIKLNTPRQLK